MTLAEPASAALHRAAAMDDDALGVTFKCPRSMRGIWRLLGIRPTVLDDTGDPIIYQVRPAQARRAEPKLQALLRGDHR